MIELIRWIKLILVDNLVPTINLFSLEYTIARLNINCCKSFYHSQSVAKYCCIFNWLQFGLKLCCLFYSKLIGCTDQDVLLSRCFELWGTVRNALLSIRIQLDPLQLYYVNASNKHKNSGKHLNNKLLLVCYSDAR